MREQILLGVWKGSRVDGDNRVSFSRANRPSPGGARLRAGMRRQPLRSQLLGFYVSIMGRHFVFLLRFLPLSINASKLW